MKDSVGSAERKDFFDAFMNFETEQSGITYIRTEDKIQYSSGVCEVYPIIQMLFDARVSVFNKVYRDNFEALAPNGHLSITFYSALSELHFGVSNDQNSFVVRRRKAEELRKQLQEGKLMYSVKDKFSTHFNQYMQASIDMLESINQGEMSLPVSEEEKIVLFKKIAKKLNHSYNDNLVKLFVSGISSGILTFAPNRISELESANGFAKGSLTELMDFYKGDNFLRAIFDEGYVDVNHPKTYIRAGYAYWKTLEYAEMFDRRVTRYILSNTNFSDETKKAMLSAIYPNNDSFLTIDELDIYAHINDYYNGVDYERVAQLLTTFGISYTKTTNDISSIFAEITLSKEPSLENLPHFIAWNRRFREDIFRHVAVGNDASFNQKIIPFFFETNEVNPKYVETVAQKHNFYIDLDSGKNPDLIDFVTSRNIFDIPSVKGSLVMAQGNDREEFFDNMRSRVRDLNNRKDVLVKLGTRLDQQNLTFRSFFPEYVQDDKIVKVDILGEIKTVFNDQGNPLIRVTSTIKIFDVMLSRVDEYDDLIVRDIDDFSGAILGKVEELKTTIAAIRSRPAAMVMAKPAPMQTETSTAKPVKAKKKTKQEPQPVVGEENGEELTLEAWEQLKEKIVQTNAKFSGRNLTHLKTLVESLSE